MFAIPFLKVQTFILLYG